MKKLTGFGERSFPNRLNLPAKSACLATRSTPSWAATPSLSSHRNDAPKRSETPSAPPPYADPVSAVDLFKLYFSTYSHIKQYKRTKIDQIKTLIRLVK